MNCWQEVEWLRQAVRDAGNAILRFYHAGTAAAGASAKPDGSPLTLADSASHRILAAWLAEYSPGIPVLSEEGREIPYAERRRWRRLWLVDPLDGTKEFVLGLDEFTVNVALVEDGAPRLGIVYSPVLDALYFGSAGSGAFLQRSADTEPKPIRVRSISPPAGLTVVQSRSHATPEQDEYLAGYAIADRVSAGSSLKFCLVAEGKADLYPRLGPTMEWDTAAGQAVVQAAGGEVVAVQPAGTRTEVCNGQGKRICFEELDALRYNRKDLLNPWFVARPSTS